MSTRALALGLAAAFSPFALPTLIGVPLILVVVLLLVAVPGRAAGTVRLTLGPRPETRADPRTLVPASNALACR